MLGRLKPVLCGHCVLNRLELGGKKLDDLSTFGADHVVVVLMLVVMLIVGATVAKANFARQARLRQKLERSINRGLANSRVVLLHQPVEIFAGHMLFGPQKHV